MPCQLVRFCPQGHVAAPVKSTPQVADQASKHGRKSSVTKWYHESWDKKNNEKVTTTQEIRYWAEQEWNEEQKKYVPILRSKEDYSIKRYNPTTSETTEWSWTDEY